MIDQPKVATVLEICSLACEEALHSQDKKPFVFMMRLASSSEERKIIATLFERHLLAGGVEVAARQMPDGSLVEGVSYLEGTLCNLANA